MSQATASPSLLPVLFEREQEPAPRPSWYARASRAAGAGVWKALQTIGLATRDAWLAVDPDVRRDLSRYPVMAPFAVGPRQRPVVRRKDDGHRPIVFVHGLGGHPGNFLPIRAWLALGGRTRTYSIGLTGPGLEPKAAQLRDYIARVVEVNGLGPDDQIDVVAHSMGGVVSRLALLDLCTAMRVACLVTMGSPHGGTQAARWAGTEDGFGLRPGSPEMQALQTQLPWHGATRLVCFWSEADPVMQPARTAAVPGAANREIEGYSHLDWLLKQEQFRKVARELQQRATDLSPTRPDHRATAC
jgi:triacylglycerol esterase/lipase EstA (alpha/beta hydrolase family)